MKVKATIYGALGYFILPLDVIIDFAPLGYTDDLTVLGAAIVMASLYIDKDVKIKARKKLKEIFGKFDERKLREIDRKIERGES